MLGCIAGFGMTNRELRMKFLKTITCASAIAIGAASSGFAGELTVYTASEAEYLPQYAAKFNEDHPDIKINWVRDSTGIAGALQARRC